MIYFDLINRFDLHTTENALPRERHSIIVCRSTVDRYILYCCIKQSWKRKKLSRTAKQA